MYAFLEFASVLTLLGVALFSTKSPILGALSVTAGIALAVGSQYMGGLLVPTVLVLCLVLKWRKGQSTRRVWMLAGASLLGAAIWLPWMFGVIPDQIRNTWGNQTRITVRDLVELPIRHVLIELDAIPSQFEALGYLVGGSILASMALFAWRLIRDRRAEHLLIGAAFVVPVSCALAATLFTPPNFTPKYLMVASPSVALMIGAGIASSPSRLLSGSLASIVLVGAVFLSLLHKTGNLREDYRSACTELIENWRPGEPVFVVSGPHREHSESTVRYYLRRREDILDAINHLESSDPRSSMPWRDHETRIHVVYREAQYAVANIEWFYKRYDVLKASPSRFRIQYIVFVPRKGRQAQN